MGHVAVICDSTCDMPHEKMVANGVTVVPLKVTFGPDTYLDGRELSAADFWALLASSPHHPQTSQPSPGDFLNALEAAKADGATGAVVITLSSGVSGTYGAAVLAARAMSDFPVEVVDTKLASGVLGLIATEAAALAQSGAPLGEVAALARKRAASAVLLFVVDSLEWLRRNGRIGRATALLGSLVSLKPVLSLDEEGTIVPIERVRGRARAIARLVELTGARFAAGTRLHLAVMHGQCEADAQALRAALAERYQLAREYVGPIGSVIGSHVGPGTIGILAYPD
jgi:DegV family protein with EDD domain